MPDELIAELQLQRELVSGAYVFPDLNRIYTTPGRKQDIFKAIQKHFEACGIETKEAATDERKRAGCKVGFHSLRHTFMTLTTKAAGALPSQLASSIPVIFDAQH